MNNIAKILLGIGVVGAVAATTYVVTKKSEEKEVENDIPDENGEEKADKASPKDFVSMIKEGASKKATQILAWVIIHKNQLETVGTALGLFAGVLGVVNAVKEYTLGKKLHETLGEVLDFQDEFKTVWNKKIDGDMERYSKVLEELEHLNHIITEGV